MNKLVGWGQYPSILAQEVYPSSIDEVLRIASTSNKNFIPRGNGRSYGDSSMNKNLTINMLNCNKFLNWDEKTGDLILEAGVLIEDIIDYFLPRGWFPYVTPGTKFVTVGGAIASDVHGKNHHFEGSFGNYVNWIDVLYSGKIRRCSAVENNELFNWTIGGMGLTGIILRCSIKLKKVDSGWISQQVIINNDFAETIDSFSTYSNSTYSVAWIDCLATGKNFGRSILMLGEHLEERELAAKAKKFPPKKSQIFNVPFFMPSFVLNNFSVAAFNFIYFNLAKFRKRKSLIDWDSYFYPLDTIGNWNRLYGRNGFFQFQCLLPHDQSVTGYTKILKMIQDNSSGSFLGVLKNLGNGNGYFSFPSKGLTLALDFKLTRRNIKLAKELHRIVADHNGKIYLAKDALMDEEEFFSLVKKSEIKEFYNFINLKSSSLQSDRLGVTNE